ncbi:FMN-binding protein [candidate division KSB1 bacterium]
MKIVFCALVVSLLLLFPVCMKPPGPSISSLPPYDLPDGDYSGFASEEIMGKQVAARVELTLEAGRITRLKVLEGTSLIAGVDSLIPERIMRYQTPDVEAVTGATASADIIMRATKRALMEARKKRVN